MLRTRLTSAVMVGGVALMTGCTWIPTMVSQGVDAVTTIGEHRSFYATLEDYATKSEIVSRLMDENLVLDVNTDVYKGRVMLTGLVKSAATRKKAEELARQVPAVQELFNDLQITEEGGFGVTLSDLAIETHMRLMLMMAEGVKSINYRWRANKGVVYLLGTADSPEELAHVVSLASETAGVREVVVHVTSQEADESEGVVNAGRESTPAEIAIAQAATANFLRGEVISVNNGDSFTVLIGPKLVKVQLIGSDAPDMTQSPTGRQAREFLRNLVRGKMVRLETDDRRRDHEKRLLAYVYVGDLFVNLELIRQGHAVMYSAPPNVAHVEEYRKAQQEAREAGRGLWGASSRLASLRITPAATEKTRLLDKPGTETIVGPK
jgi:endonuclease YncB( thermonuclease family)/osmotically-inducible protein OsmY